MRNADPQKLLDTPETNEERRRLDALHRDPDEVLSLVRIRIREGARAASFEPLLPAPKRGSCRSQEA
jgi:hypothetical protein